MKMKYIVLIIGLCSLLFAVSSQAELEIYKDYDIGKEVTSMTTVRIDPNMEDVYLEGLRESWVKAVRLQKELGYIKDWKIFASELPQSGEFNMVLMVMFENSADLEPNQEKYKNFMKSWGQANQDNSRKITKTYPNVRTLTGEYRLREIIMK
ncbi:hypothetical protein BCU94_06980 [Shewanella sp. 10N.286.52.C2]|nr:hypothetical protein BCU94_06980 [Shewanella sp. 10N.286.52.C2]PMG42708.1 hypothetical protein BCU91_07120 [Shewanella sp. 10N.286.52.B9]PMH86264.1 hypothetical protein BCU57_11380 [Shewanella sp. 10N.286.48.B5]PMH98223.1 hypothetical protein BCU55_16655 [Shewanella sp. 10N.286.48.A6]